MKIWTLFEPKHKNFKWLLKIEGSLKKILNIKRLMSIPSPLKQYHFLVILIWWHSPFKYCNIWRMSEYLFSHENLIVILKSEHLTSTRWVPTEIGKFLSRKTRIKIEGSFFFSKDHPNVDELFAVLYVWHESLRELIFGEGRPRISLEGAVLWETELLESWTYRMNISVEADNVSLQVSIFHLGDVHCKFNGKIWCSL
jgi:hypothetical protein